MKNQIVSSLWIGDKLPVIAQLAIKSHLSIGHEFHLYTYSNVSNVPVGAIMKDANQILDQSLIYTHNNKSLAPFSDWWRYAFLYKIGGCWFDLDIILLKPFKINSIMFYCYDEGPVSPAFLSFSQKNHPIAELLYNFCCDPSLELPWDTVDDKKRKDKIDKDKLSDYRKTASYEQFGSTVLTECVRHFKLYHHGVAKKKISPIDAPNYAYMYLEPFEQTKSSIKDAWAVHLFGDLVRRYSTPILKGCMVDSLMQRFF